MDEFNYIQINQNSRIPKYRQIVNSIIHNISLGNLKMGQKIPSINRFSEEFYLSRDTVEKAYNILKKQKIISPVKGKGFYITKTKRIFQTNIIFIINKFSEYKMEIYNSFISSIKGNVHTDLHIYHYDESTFLNILERNIGGYDYYIILPHFKTADLKHINSTDAVINTIKRIPKEKLIILDNKLELGDGIVQIYQDFENDIYHALNEGLDKILGYKRLILVFPENLVYPHSRSSIDGFKKFCTKHSIDFEIFSEVSGDTILEKGDLYITIKNSDLVNLINQIRNRKLVMGKDIGVISYNETPLKELLNITVISTNFTLMGQTAAQMILENKKGEVKNPFDFIDRGSV